MGEASVVGGMRKKARPQPKDPTAQRQLAAERKRRQRKKNAGIFKEIHCKIGSDVYAKLVLCHKIEGGAFQEMVAKFLTDTCEAKVGNMAPFLKTVKQFWPKIRPLLPYTKYLVKPGVTYTIGSRTLKADDWLELVPVWTQMTRAAQRLGHTNLVSFFDSLYEVAKTT